MIEVGDIYMLNSQGIRLKVVDYLAARDATPASKWMRALPAKPATYVVMEMDGPTAGVTWTATETFFGAHCTPVQEIEGEKK